MARALCLTCALPHPAPYSTYQAAEDLLPALAKSPSRARRPGAGGGALGPRAAFWDVKSSRGARAGLGSGVRACAALWGLLLGRWPHPP